MKLMMTSLLAAPVLAGCATPPPLDAQALPATPPAFKAQAQAQTVAEGRWALVPPADAEPRGDWWLAFGDATLNELVKRALATNTELQAAAARLAQARALLRNADACLACTAETLLFFVQHVAAPYFFLVSLIVIFSSA